jgi:RNA polymerase sigma-70 factor (ECF subfamily)
MQSSLASALKTLHSGGPSAPHTSEDRKEDDSCKTSSSLLVRLRDKADQQAWAAFVDRYTPMIQRWCKKWFPHEADDMVQEVLAKLVESIASFEYKPQRGRFRGWLKTVAQRLMVASRRRHSLRGQCGALEHPDLVAMEAAHTDLVGQLIAEYERELLGLACERVRPRVDPKTWFVFVETAERGRRPAEVARELGMPVGSVYQARYSITRLLRQEVKALEGPA